ncbi:MAG: hypothetical protein GY842_19695, partial [bacterium]|nr:hypothetical protein [bacterium]
MWPRRRDRSQPGGIDFTATKAAIAEVPIRTLPARTTLHVPLFVPSLPTSTTPEYPGVAHEATEVLVNPGETVAAGRLLARGAAGEPDWVRVFAPAAGRVGDRAAGMSACGHALPTLELTPDSDQHSLGD